MKKQGFFKQHPEEKKNLTSEALARLEFATVLILDYVFDNITKKELVEELSKRNYSFSEKKYVREIFDSAFKIVEDEACFYKPNPRIEYLHQIEVSIYLKQDKMLTIWEFLDELKKYDLTDAEYTFFTKQHMRRIEEHLKDVEPIEDECPKGFIKNE